MIAPEKRTVLRLLALTLLAAMTAWPAAWPAAPAAASGVLDAAGWPLAGRVEVVRAFDPPRSAWGAGHRGADLAGLPDAAVLAAADGRVSFAGRVGSRGVVVVAHGILRTTYEPVVPLVAAGERVRRGSVIGRLVAGHCPQPCLHWGLREGDRYLDPTTLLDRGVAGSVRLLPASAVDVARRRAAARAAAARAATARIALLSAGPDPVPGTHGFVRPVPGSVTSGFGMRLHPVLHMWKLHDGTDLGAACGTPIRAAYAGRVASRALLTGYGNRLVIDHGRVDGYRARTGYSHAASFVVHVGQEVRRGQVVGHVGRTGYATACHLHLMLWLDGRLVNPLRWFT